jgi:hypothetical protein
VKLVDTKQRLAVNVLKEYHVLSHRDPAITLKLAVIGLKDKRSLKMT